jgi:cytochrome P450 family 6
MNSLAAQAFVFFLGGYETSSTTMTFCVYELALHQDIQDRLREEIDDVLQKHDGKLTYEGIQQMEYLDKVVSGKQFLKNIPKTGHTLLNTAMSLEHLPLLYTMLQSKLKMRSNPNLPVFCARDLFLFFRLLFI